MFLIDVIICGALMSQIQISECQASPRFGIQKLPDPSLPTVHIEEPIHPVSSPQDPPSRSSFPQQASPQDPPPRSSFSQQASPQDLPPRPSFAQQAHLQDPPSRSSFPQQASPQDPPPRSSFSQQASPQDLPPRPSFAQQAHPQDPPSRSSFPQQASPQDPPPRSSFSQQASPQDLPPRPSFDQQAHLQNSPPRTSFPQQANVDIVRSNMNGPNKDGSYSFSYETSDGSKREEQGRFHGPSSSLSVRGSYSYIAPDGTLVEVKYIADERGFRAKSPHIPSIPSHSLEQIKAAGETAKGKPKPEGEKPFFETKIAAPLRNIPN